MKRILAVILALALALSLSGCAEEGKQIITSEEPPVETSATPPATTSIADLWKYAIAEIDGETILANELRYQLLTLLETYLSYTGFIDWALPIEDKAADDYFRDEAIANIKMFRAVERLAAELGMELTEDELALLDTEIEDYIYSQFSSIEEFEELLGADGLTLDVYKYVVTIPDLYYKIYESLYTAEDALYAPAAETVRSYFDNGYVTTRHIMMSLVDAEGNAMSEEDASAAYLRALEAYELLMAGEDFEYVMSLYNEDTSFDGSMTFDPASTQVDYAAVAGSLDDLSYSGIEMIASTYVIIQRLPLNAEFFTENEAEITEQYLVSNFNDLLETYMDKMDVTLLPAFYDIKAEDIYYEY